MRSLKIQAAERWDIFRGKVMPTIHCHYKTNGNYLGFPNTNGNSMLGNSREDKDK